MQAPRIRMGYTRHGDRIKMVVKDNGKLKIDRSEFPLQGLHTDRPIRYLTCRRPLIADKVIELACTEYS